MMCGCVCVSVFMSYLLQLLDDRDGNLQLTDIFLVVVLSSSAATLFLISIYPSSTCHTWVCSNNQTRTESGKCVASYRAGNVATRHTRVSLSLLGSAARRRPWQTLKSLLPNTIVQDRVEGTIMTFAHAPSCNVFTPSRTPDQTLK
jgi:hypothetical protein